MLSNIIRRLCQTLAREASGEEEKRKTIHEDGDDDDDDHDKESTNDADCASTPLTPAPAPPPPSCPSSPSSLPRHPPPPAPSPSTEIPPNRRARRSFQKESKTSLSPSHASYDGPRPSTAPSTPRSSSPRLLRSFSRFGLPSSPSSPSLHVHVPRLSFSSSPHKAKQSKSAQPGNANEFTTPPLSFCSKEVAQDPFARVCPSPELSRSSSATPSAASPTPTRPSNTCRHASSKVPSSNHSKTSIRPSTAPSLSIMNNESACSSQLDFACAGRDSTMGSDVDLSIMTSQNSTFDAPKKPVLPAVSTSYSSSTSSSRDPFSITSHSSSASSAWRIGSPTSPSSPDLSYFSSSFSSTRSGFTDASFSTADTVTTCTVSSESGGKGSAGRRHNGRNQSDMFVMDIFGETSSPLSTFSPAYGTHKRSTTIEEDNLFAEEAGVPDAIVKRGIEAQERLKYLRPAHTASKFVEDLRRSQDSSTAGSSQLGSTAESTVNQSENTPVVVSSDAFYEHFKPHLRFAGRGQPSCRRSFTAPASLASSSSFFTSAFGRKEQTLKHHRSGNQIHSCTPTPSGPSTPQGDMHSSISPFELLNKVIAQEDEKDITGNGEESYEGNTSSSLDHFNHGISFTQSTFDLRLDYGDGIRTSIPLPQMSWFPEPPPSSSPPLHQRVSTSSFSLSNKLPFSSKNNGSIVNKKNNMMIKRPATSDGIDGKKLSGWSLMGRGKPKIGKSSIGYPVASA